MFDNDSEVNTETVVDVDVTNTDDLAAFETEFYGTGKEEEDVTDVEADADAEVAEPDAEAESEPETDSEEEADEEDEEEQAEPEPKRNRKTAKERISELTAKNREIEARAAAEIAALKALLEKKEDKAPAKVEEESRSLADDRPDPDAKDENGELKYPLGKLDPEFAADIVRWTMKVEREQEAAAARARAEEEAKAAEARELVTQWEDKLVATEEEVPELRQKIAVLESQFADLEPTHGQFLVETIMRLEKGPEVLLYLSDNLSEAEAIVAASPVAATLALGRIEGRLSASTRKESNDKKVTTAPKPPLITRGSGANKARVSPDTDNLDDFEREFFKPIRV